MINAWCFNTVVELVVSSPFLLDSIFDHSRLSHMVGQSVHKLYQNESDCGEVHVKNIVFLFVHIKESSMEDRFIDSGIASA
jgi:hypothetical protein